MKKIFWAIILSALLAGPVFANQTAAVSGEVRFLADTAKEEGAWLDFLGNLKGVKARLSDGSTVLGYDSNTNQVHLPGVRAYLCTNSFFRSACEDGDYASWASRNGWSGEFMLEADLRKQARKGIFFPAAVASSTTATPVAAVTPTQLKTLETTLTAVQTALQDKVAQNAQAVVSLREEVATKERAINELREQLAKAPEAARTALKVEIAAAMTAEKSARDALKTQLEAGIRTKIDVEMKATIQGAGEAATKAVAPAASQATAALKATERLGGRVKEAEASASAATAGLQNVDGRVSAVEKFGIFSVLGLGLLALVAIALGAITWRKTTANTRAINAVGTMASEAKDLANDAKDLANDAKGVASRAMMTAGQARALVDKNIDMVTSLATRTVRLEEALRAEEGTVQLPDSFEFSLSELEEGQSFTPWVRVTNGEGVQESFEVEITRLETLLGNKPAYLISGINDHDPCQPVNAKEVAPTLYRAGGKGFHKDGRKKEMRFSKPVALDSAAPVVTEEAALFGLLEMNVSNSAPAGAVAEVPGSVVDMPIAAIPSGDDVVAVQPVAPAPATQPQASAEPPPHIEAAMNLAAETGAGDMVFPGGYRPNLRATAR